MNNALVSIIIPTYNNSELLKQMIVSILAQTYENWELIIVDDVSQDDTQICVAEFQNRDARIKYFLRDRDPKGGQTCRNIGFAISKGEYVVFFDADDVVSSTCLEQRVLFMTQNKNIDFGIFPAVAFSDKEGKRVFDYKSVWGKNRNTDVLSSFLRADYQFAVWTNIYKRESVLNISWDERVLIFQDFDYNVSSIFSKLKYKFSDSDVFDYFYRVGYSDNSVCSRFITNEKYESVIYLFSKTIKNIARIYGHHSKYKKDFFGFILHYFYKLVADGDIELVNKYVIFCSGYYSWSKISEMKIYSFLSRNIIKKNKTMDKYLIKICFPGQMINTVLRKINRNATKQESQN